MKRLFLLLVLCGMVAVGCTEGGVDDNIDNGGNNTEQPDNGGNEDESDIPENIFFGLDKESATISPDGGSVDVTVYSNYKWEISGTSDWCTPSITKGDANEDGQKVTFSADVAYDNREATFWFRCADEKIKVVVSQKLKKVIIPDANNSFDISAEGGIAVISYKTSVDCEVIIPDEAQDWITIAPATRGLVSEDINLNVAENTTYDPRTAVIKVVAKDNAELVIEYTINQEQNDAILADENNTFTVPGKGGKVVIKYQTNVDCEVIIPGVAQDWITIAPATRGLVSESINLNVAENTTYDPRTAVIKVVAKDNAELVIEYTINQEQNDAILADENNTFTVPGKGGKVVIKYQTNVDCEVIIPGVAQDWITIAPATRGLVSESINLNVAENTTYSARSAVIKVVAKGDSEVFAEYTINQKQNDELVAYGENEFIVGGYEQQISIKHKTNVDCEVIIPEEAQDWITIVPATRGLVTYSTILNIAKNSTNEQRQAIVKVVAKDNSELFEDYVITQNYGDFILYTSTNGKIVEPYSYTFGVSMQSNTYDNGVGIIKFSSPITKIGDYTFRNCSSLTSITIPNSVTEIGDGAFNGCSSLNEFKGKFASDDGRCLIVDGVLNAFGIGCGVTEYTIPSSVKSIGSYAFHECSSLKIVTIPNSVTSIGSYAFSDCTSLTSITIPDSVTSIGSYAFHECSSLKIATIPNSVTWIGSYAFSDCTSLTSVTIPDSVTSIGINAFSGCTGELIVNCNIPSASSYNYGVFHNSDFTKVTIGDSVTSIGDYAFRGCNSLTSITIPDSVTSIGEYALSNCRSLTSVTIPDSVTEIGGYAFEGCSSLISITIPDSVTSIGEYAFYDCSSLINITIPNSVTSIGSYAFSDCTSLTSVTIPDSVTSIGSYAFSDCTSLTSVTIPDSVTSIGSYAFSDCTSLTSVTIPDSVTSIGDYAFSDCTSLTSITIPDSVTSIGSYAFYNCDSLTSVTIGNGVTKIGGYAFYSCGSLTSVTIGNGVTSIGNNAFSYCNSLTSVTIGKGVTSIGDRAFYDCDSLTSVYITDIAAWCNISFGSYASNPLEYAGNLYLNNELVTDLIIPDSVTSIGDYAFRYCTSLTSVTIPESVTSIGDYAFRYCDSLTSVTIGNGVTSIGEMAFSYCDSLTSVTIPDSVTSIGEDAFSGCTSLTSVTIGNGVTKIGGYAFYYCNSLKEIYCKPTTPPTGGSSMFKYSASGSKIYVPRDSVEAYKSASGWSSYASAIVGYDF